MNATCVERKQIFKPTLKRSKKKCEYSGCSEIFMGVVNGGNPSKYCEEHRKNKYRKIMDTDKIKPKRVIKATESSNQIIKHSYKHANVIMGKCQLVGCGKDFEILVIPNTYVYPRYCPDHRNEFKRKRFLTNGKVD